MIRYVFCRNMGFLHPICITHKRDQRDQRFQLHVNSSHGKHWTHSNPKNLLSQKFDIFRRDLVTKDRQRHQITHCKTTPSVKEKVHNEQCVCIGILLNALSQRHLSLHRTLINVCVSNRL